MPERKIICLFLFARVIVEPMSMSLWSCRSTAFSARFLTWFLLNMYNNTVFIPSSRTLLDCVWHPLILLTSRDWLIPPWLTDRTWLSLAAIVVPLLPRVPSSMAVPPFLWTSLSFSYSSSLPSRIPPCSPGRVSPALCWDGLVQGRLCIFLGPLRFRVGKTGCEEYKRNFLHTERQNKIILETLVCCHD